MKAILSLPFLLLLTTAYSQREAPVTTASMMANSAKITIDRCADQDAYLPTINRIVVQPDYSEQEIDFLNQLPLAKRDVLNEATFIDNTSLTYPYEIKISYPQRGFYVIGFSKHLNLSSTLWLNDENNLEKAVCEEDFFAVLDTQASLFSRLLSGDIDILEMMFYKEPIGTPYERWVFNKSEKDNALIVEKLTYDKSSSLAKETSTHLINASQFDELQVVELAMQRNIIEGHQTDRKTKEEIGIKSGEFTWRLSLTGKKNQFYKQLVQLFE